MQAILNNKRTASCISASDNTVLIGFTINEYNHKEHGNTYALFYKNISKVLAQKIQDTNLKVL
ncbi:MAG: hypothetical protein U9R37_02005 [Campylobacterota bacterium]|nr:hypothetical protein [Campylobacterota bacterium]